MTDIIKSISICLSLVWVLLFPVSAHSQPYRTAPEKTLFSMETYRGKKLLLFFFDLDAPQAAFLAKEVNRLHRIRNDYNFDVAAICLNPDRPFDLETFRKENNLTYKIVPDYGKAAVKKFRMAGGLGLYVFDEKGRGLSRRLFGPEPPDEKMLHTVNAFAGRYLDIGYIPEDQPVLGIKPKLPQFSVTTVDNNTLNIKDIFEKKPLVLVFFSPTCGHCRHELDFLSKLYSEDPLQGKFEIIAVSVNGGKHFEKLVQDKTFPFPVAADPKREIVSLFPSYTGSVPVSFIVDRTGNINFFHRGFSEQTKNQYLMEIRKTANLPNPPLLNKAGYSGEETCMVCHEDEHIQWSLTAHSSAYHSIIRKGKESDGNCVSCHVTGYDQPGGFTLKNKRQSKHLKNVQCESCHGPGHQSCTAFTGQKQKKRKLSEWKALCLGCHTEKESLNFKFSDRFKKVRHSSLPDFSAMDREERLALAQKLKAEQIVFANSAEYMGKEACIQCHEKEYHHWQTTVHADIHQSDRAKNAPPEKQFRYHTRIDELSNQPAKGLEGVQCETCHGPGERHVKNPEAKGQEFIVGLGRECPSCVVEQICRQCHSPEDDPDFDFETEFEKIRHK